MIAIDMKMPDNCATCRFRYPFDYCVAITSGEDDCYFGPTRPENCPLIKVDKVMAEAAVSSDEVARYPDDVVERYTMDMIKKKLLDYIIRNNVVEITQREMDGPFNNKIVRATVNVVMKDKERKNEGIDADALENEIDKERIMLLEQDRFGSEHILEHHARRLVEDAPTINVITIDWLRKKMYLAEEAGDLDAFDVIEWLIHTWHKEQEDNND